jgi:hypothetical protein
MKQEEEHVMHQFRRDCEALLLSKVGIYQIQFTYLVRDWSNIEAADSDAIQLR